MPKKQKQESQQEQSERFRKAVQDLIDAGELNPAEAEERLELAVSRAAQRMNRESSA
jgi:hypothetical protein